MTLLEGGSEIFSLVDIRECNPWWQSKDNLPEKGTPRADFHWRIRNTVSNQLQFIPGPPGTGKTATLEQMVRALVYPDEYDEQGIPELSSVSKECEPDQICYIPCDDPLARLEEGFIASAVNLFLAERTGKDFVVLLDGVHRLPEWRDQVSSLVSGLNQNFPQAIAVPRLARSSSG